MSNGTTTTFCRVGTVGGILLALFLIVYGAKLLGLDAIPNWAIGLDAVFAGLLILVGR